MYRPPPQGSRKQGCSRECLPRRAQHCNICSSHKYMAVSKNVMTTWSRTCQHQAFTTSLSLQVLSVVKLWQLYHTLTENFLDTKSCYSTLVLLLLSHISDLCSPIQFKDAKSIHIESEPRHNLSLNISQKLCRYELKLDASRPVSLLSTLTDSLDQNLAPLDLARRRRSLKTPAAVTSAPAPGPRMNMGCSLYLSVLKEMMLSAPCSCANAWLCGYAFSPTSQLPVEMSICPT